MGVLMCIVSHPLPHAHPPPRPTSLAGPVLGGRAGHRHGARLAVPKRGRHREALGGLQRPQGWPRRARAHGPARGAAGAGGAAPAAVAEAHQGGGHPGACALYLSRPLSGPLSSPSLAPI